MCSSPYPSYCLYPTSVQSPHFPFAVNLRIRRIFFCIFSHVFYQSLSFPPQPPPPPISLFHTSFLTHTPPRRHFIRAYISSVLPSAYSIPLIFVGLLLSSLFPSLLQFAGFPEIIFHFSLIFLPSYKLIFWSILNYILNSSLQYFVNMSIPFSNPVTVTEPMRQIKRAYYGRKRQV
jgi:hypothetical protein